MKLLFPVVILAGGLATRLRPVTASIPKALVEVAGKPFICWQLEYLRDQGVRNVVICVGYLGGMIQDVVGTGERFDLRVRYSYDGSALLGTGGALKKALPLLSDVFFVLYGDSYLPVDFSEVQDAYERSRQPALMTVLKNEDRWDKSNVLFVDGQVVEYNKGMPRQEMMYIDYGLGLLSAKVFDPYPTDYAFDLAVVYQNLSHNGYLTGLEVHQRFYEIGSHSGLKEAEEYLLNKEKV
jgi:prepilin-type processing-associated H-X9-DG protein